jgi:hypothetical protein
MWRKFEEKRKNTTHLRFSMMLGLPACFCKETSVRVCDPQGYSCLVLEEIVESKPSG